MFRSQTEGRSRWSVLVLLALVAAGGWWAWGPGPRLDQPVVVQIPAGSSSWAIANQLQQAGVVHSAVGFAAWSLWPPRRLLKAGTYRFSGGQTVPAVFDMLASGRFYAVALVVPEGYNRFDIARELEQRGLASAQAFLAATASPAIIRDVDPAAVSLEGYLFPATYSIAPHTPVARIVAMMTDRFRQQLRDASPPPAGGNIHAWLTLASLVEKETPVPSERAVIAGVFRNRLVKGWTLDCDPTVAYAALLADRYTGSLHKSDLAFPSPYNTYLNHGLPPGPIANPGAAALAAAAFPATTDYLFFVSDGHGAHRFARTMAEQEANIRLYRAALGGN
jgi:UPF0755 protein